MELALVVLGPLSKIFVRSMKHPYCYCWRLMLLESLDNGLFQGWDWIVTLSRKVVVSLEDFGACGILICGRSKSFTITTSLFS